ncbi:MAG: TPM domain-containing protein [Desulforhopalus sp.]
MVKTKTLAERFLTAAEQQKVTEAVQEAERHTSGEIVPMIVSRSHEYPMAAVTCTVATTLPAALLFSSLIGEQVWIGSQNMWLFLGLFSLFYALLYPLAMRSDRLKRYFLNRRQVEQEVEKGALSAFYSEQLYDTENANGILLYISVMERKVWILADSSINAKIEQQEWDSTVNDLTTGIQAGHAAEAICEAIHRTGQILRTHFPYQRGDKDELHNLIVR